MTGPSHNEAVQVASEWLASDIVERLRRPIVPQIRERFGLSNLEAVEAIRAAQAVRDGQMGGADASAS
jgi:hypothetical protein